MEPSKCLRKVLFIVTYPETYEKKTRIQQEDDDKVFRVFHKIIKNIVKRIPSKFFIKLAVCICSVIQPEET